MDREHMMPSKQGTGLTTKNQRPWLTATCERLLLRVLPAASEIVTDPLPTIPRRLFVGKVFGMGDGILVRSIIELFHERHPNMQIGILVSPTTREVMTVEASFRVHQYILGN
jgi:hypothetical protein